jgi:hypothetical protein
MTTATIDPSTGETVKTFTPATDAEIGAALARADDPSATASPALPNARVGPGARPISSRPGPTRSRR